MNARLSHLTLQQGVQELADRDSGLAEIAWAYGPPPLWEREQGFSTLILIILEQQVSLASARAAFNRLEEVAAPLTPQSFLGLDDKELREVGFSRQKARYGRELANAMLDGSLDLAGLGELEDGEAREQLMQVTGIGPWTADIYLLRALGRPDIWPAGDLALERPSKDSSDGRGGPRPKRRGKSATRGGHGDRSRQDCCGTTTWLSKSRERLPYAKTKSCYAV